MEKRFLVFCAAVVVGSLYATEEVKPTGFHCKKGHVNPGFAMVVGSSQKTEEFERKVEKDGKVYFLSAKPVWTGADVESMRSAPESTVVQIRFSPTVAKDLSESTGKNVGKFGVLLLGNEVLSAPIIKQKISGASVILDTAELGDLKDRICKK